MKKNLPNIPKSLVFLTLMLVPVMAAAVSIWGPGWDGIPAEEDSGNEVGTHARGAGWSPTTDASRAKGGNGARVQTNGFITVTSPNGGESWDVGSNQGITWTSEGVEGYVRIEYSLDDGGSWKTIAESTENDGTHLWTVPADPSTLCLVRISEDDADGGVWDVSDAVFSIVSPVSGVITVRSPNGGESWEAGSNQEITWTSTGDIGSVTLSFSRDNGKIWKAIAQNTQNDGSFEWVVPERASDQCLVRVAAVGGDPDPRPSDVSDAVFSIVPAASPSIRVTAPKAGEQLAAGSSYTITWFAISSRENVRIEYSTSGGEAWTNITESTENSGKYDWTVPDTPSNICLIRISETDGQPEGISDGEFSIVSPEPGDLTVNSPNGGEEWAVGSVQEISWASGGGIDMVMIEYSKDYGTTWKTVAQSEVNDGSFDWTIPATVSDGCLVRISSNNKIGDPRASDVSDAFFSIALSSQDPGLTVLAPNGSEQLHVGSRSHLMWHAVNTRGDVKIEYSTDAGDIWAVIAEAAQNTGDYEWTVPDTPSELCLVRVSETDGEAVDISDAVFSIISPLPGEITVTSPNGGENWVVGSLQEITWTAGGINNVFIEYSNDFGITWNTISDLTENDGSFDWEIPDSESDECLVRVAANDGDPDPRPWDVSNAPFSILQDVTGELRVTSPNGGEEWEVGSVHSITWANSGDAGTVMIEYSTDYGSAWSTIADSAANTGNFDWTTPYAASHECLVRVTAHDDSADPRPSDVSDEVFSIVLPESPTIRVLAPNGGEELVVGSLFEISWFSTSSRDEVQVEYSTNGGDSWTEITGSTENDGDHDWTVPDEPSQTCLVRITELESQLVDLSDAVFSIVQQLPGDLTLLTPNGGEELEVGSEYEITWTGSGLNYVILEYSSSNGSAWDYIDKVPADNNSYNWTVPGTPSESCLVRVVGADSDENPWDVSDGVFTIFDQSQAFIEVLTPNGGESLGVGEEYLVTWASTGVDEVLIEYSPDVGDQWIPIDTVAALGGRYTWTVPGVEPSDWCLIRVSASPGGSPADVSDAVFSIELDP